MNATITQSEVLLLAIPLPAPFRLGFGTLYHLPRVLLLVTVEDSRGTSTSVGEASIDFPFTSYDAWDMFRALEETPLIGRSLAERELILRAGAATRATDGCHAAQAALNMALDDACARTQGVNICALYGGAPRQGRVLQSIGIADDHRALEAEITAVCTAGRVPKLKCDAHLARTRASINIAAEIAASCHTVFAADFNATLAPDQWIALMAELRGSRGMSSWLFAEQPTREEDGVSGLVAAEIARRTLLPKLRLVADESFVTADDARELVAAGVALNMKIQKLGGVARALEMEKAVAATVISLVGGTFPTALGRAYDQVAASVLANPSLPSDGWQPASDWFRDAQHLIEEPFAVTMHGTARAFSGPGLGCTPVWDRIRRFVVPNPGREYAAIRRTGAGEHLRIQSGDGTESYAALYERRSGKNWNWNLPPPETAS